MRINLKVIDLLREYWVVDLRFFMTGGILNTITQQGPVKIRILESPNSTSTFIRVEILKGPGKSTVSQINQELAEIFINYIDAANYWNQALLNEIDRRTKLHEELMNYYKTNIINIE